MWAATRGGLAFRKSLLVPPRFCECTLDNTGHVDDTTCCRVASGTQWMMMIWVSMLSTLTILTFANHCMRDPSIEKPRWKPNRYMSDVLPGLLLAEAFGLGRQDDLSVVLVFTE
jgi:hypothetical protein